MLVYTVVEGDTLSGIAEKLGTTSSEMLRLNELENENVLVPGLHLLAPGPATLAQTYTVRSGDTLPRIAQRIGVSTNELENWSGLRESKGVRLKPGQRLVLPKRITKKRTIEVNGYLIPTGTQTDAGILQDVGESLTYLCIFSYQVRADGSLLEEKDQNARAAARRYNVVPLMTLTNFDGNGFNTELAHTVMANASIRRRLIDNILRTMRNRGFGGVNVDFEHMRPTDREWYNRFIQELRRTVKAVGYSISIAMGPKTKDEPTAAWMGAFDYKTLGREVDFVMLMTYEWGWVGGPPMTTNLLLSAEQSRQRRQHMVPYIIFIEDILAKTNYLRRNVYV